MVLLNPVKDKKTQLSIVHHESFLEVVSQIGYFDPNRLKPFVANFDPKSVTDSRLLPVIFAGKGKMYSLEGDFKSADSHFKYAMKLARQQNSYLDNPLNDESYAYVLYELGLFQILINEISDSENSFREARIYAQSLNLNKLLDYQSITREVEKGHADISKLENIVNELYGHKILIMHVIGLHKIATLYVERENYEQAHRHLDLSLGYARKHNYQYLISLIQNTIAYTYIKQNMFEQARDILVSNLMTIKSHYLKALSYENIAVIEYKKNNFANSFEYCLNALNISFENNVMAKIPGQSYFLGDLLSQYLDKPVDARHYYRIGYEFVLEHTHYGLNVTGDRLEAVKKYVSFLQDHSEFDKILSPKKNMFEFFVGKNWNEIKTIFHYNLIVYSKLSVKPNTDIFKSLKIKPSTYYTIHSKLVKKGFFFPDFRKKTIDVNNMDILPSLQSYIQKVEDQTWKGITKQFEEDIFYFLFKKYGFQKTRLGQILELSYPMILEKTKLFTSDDKYLSYVPKEKPN